MEFERSSRDASREEACARLARILTEQFPDEKLESLTAAQDLERSLSGCYARGLLRSAPRFGLFSEYWPQTRPS